MQNFSLYNIRKTVRQAQNVLMDPQPELLAVRSATTTDSWGPSTEQLEAVMKESYRVGTPRIVDVVFARVSEYLGSQGARARGGSVSEKLYYSAVHYVNSGNEWRIVLKCLKVVEYLVIGSESIECVEEYFPVLESVVSEYQEKARLDATATAMESTATTAAQIKQAEHYKAVVVQAELVLRLCKDPAFREAQMKIASKMDDNRVGKGNGAVLHKTEDDVPAYMANFKEKKLDRSKIGNSNLKSEIRNQIGHSYHPKERRPGMYQVAGQEMWKPESLLDDEDDGQDYDYDSEDEGHINSGYSDTPYGTSKKPVLESTDSFGGFQGQGEAPESPVTPHQEPLLSFDEPDTPSTPVFVSGVHGTKKTTGESDVHDLLL